jgi:hypothetical protein
MRRRASYHRPAGGSSGMQPYPRPPRGIDRPPMIGRHDDGRDLPHELILLH